jgi:hypothetical protein
MVGNNNSIYTCGIKSGIGGLIEKTTFNQTTSSLESVINISSNELFAYTALRLKNENIIALGGNCITYGNVVSNIFTNVFMDEILNDVFIYDNNCAIVVGNNGCIYYTNSGFAVWTRCDPSLLNKMGNADSLLDISNHFIHISMNNDTFVLSTASRFYLLYAPHLFFPEKVRSVIDISGHMTIDGHIRSNQSSVELFTGVNTLSVATNSKQLIMGNTSVYLKGNAFLENLFLGNALALSNGVSIPNSLLSNNPLKVHRDLWLTGNLVIDGSAQITVTGTGSGSGVVFTNGISEDLSGIIQKQFFVSNSSVTDNRGSGFFIFAPKTDNVLADPSESLNNHGFFKISDQSENLLSFRSNGDRNVVAMNMPQMQSETNSNNLLLLNTINSSTFSNELDNFQIISSKYTVLPISVQGSFIDVKNIFMTGNLCFTSNNLIVTTIGNINSTSLFQLKDISSNIQSQLNSCIKIAEPRDVSFSGSVAFSQLIANTISISSIEVSYLKNVSSNIQSQLDSITITASGSGKATTAQDNIFTAKNYFSEIELSGGTFTIPSGSSFNVIGNTITARQLSYLNNISSNIQTQLNDRVLWNDTRDLTLYGNISLLSSKVLMNPSYTLWTRGNVVMENGTGNIDIGNSSQSTNLVVYGQHTVHKNLNALGNIFAHQQIDLQGNLIVNGNSISPTVLSYLEGATDNLQDQINNIKSDLNLSIYNPNVFEEKNTFLKDVTVGNTLIVGNILVENNLRVENTLVGNTLVGNTLVGNTLVGNTLSVGNSIQLIGTTAFATQITDEFNALYTLSGTQAASLYTNGSIYCLGNKIKKNLVGPNGASSDRGNIIEDGMIFCRDLSLNNIFTLQGNLFVNGNAITPVQLSYLNGVTSNIQDQLSTRSHLNDVSFGANLDVCGNVLCNGTMKLEGNLFVNGNTITSVQLSYLNGVTSNIQNQLSTRSYLNDVSFGANLDVCGNVLCNGTMKLQGNLFVNGNTITPVQLSYLNGVTSNIQDQLSSGSRIFLNDVSFRANVDVSGNITSAKTISALNFTSLSDYRIKTNVLPLTHHFVVDHLQPVSYYNLLKNKEDIGFIAHELQTIYPFLVSGSKNGTDYQSIDYTGLIPILVKEIQELKKRVVALESN